MKEIENNEGFTAHVIYLPKAPSAVVAQGNNILRTAYTT